MFGFNKDLEARLKAHRRASKNMRPFNWLSCIFALAYVLWLIVIVAIGVAAVHFIRRYW